MMMIRRAHFRVSSILALALALPAAGRAARRLSPSLGKDTGRHRTLSA